MDNDLATYCPAMLQGNNRLDRILKWKMYLNFFYNDDNIHNVVFAEGVVHDPVQMLKSFQGKCVIFNICQNAKKFPSHPHDGSPPSEVKPEGSIFYNKFVNGDNNNKNKIVDKIFQKTIDDAEEEIPNIKKYDNKMKNLRPNEKINFQNVMKKMNFDENNNKIIKKNRKMQQNENENENEIHLEIENQNEVNENYSQKKEKYDSRAIYLKYMTQDR